MSRLDPASGASHAQRTERPPGAASRERVRSFAAALRGARGAPAKAGEGAQAREEERRAGLAAPPEGPAAGAGSGELSPAPSLRGAARALPVAVSAFGPRAAEGLALDLGRSLSVELRGAPAGVEVTLRPSPALARVAAAELPDLVKALRRRGVLVSRAEVRPGMPPRVGAWRGPPR